MADGCSGVVDLGFTQACNNHDRKYHFGGSVEDKLIADDDFYEDMCATPGFWGFIARRGVASIRYHGVRMLTYNYPPGHKKRSLRHGMVEAWNWAGPGIDEDD